MLNGILGTIIFHLVLMLIFLVVKLGDVRKKHLESIQIEFLNEYTKLEDLIHQKQQQVEMPSLDDRVAKNIAVNVTEKMHKKIGTDQYVEELKKELGIKELNQQLDRNLPEDKSPEFMENKPDKEKETGRKEQSYKGKTNIKVDLPQRTIRHQDVPVYLCEGGGVVIIDIVVDQAGNIVNASYSSNSRSKDDCLIEQAINSSYKFRFNSDLKADPRQKGTITFQFIPQ